MKDLSRRSFLKTAAGTAASAVALSALPPSIRKALAIPAAVTTGTINDIQHVVILMLENRGFNHYFGTLKGVRGFGDRHPAPNVNGTVFKQVMDTAGNIGKPWHANREISNVYCSALNNPHDWISGQYAWNQGAMWQYALVKTEAALGPTANPIAGLPSVEWEGPTPFSMGYLARGDLPYQYALADAFTICDSYHCAVLSCTGPNRAAFWGGSNFQYSPTANGNIGNSEMVNDRVSGNPNTPNAVTTSSVNWTWGLGDPAFTFLSLPEVLQNAGVTWQMYQDINNNWGGLMNGSFAFAGIRAAGNDTTNPINQRALQSRLVSQLKDDVIAGTLPQVSWIVPSEYESEHVWGSSPNVGANYVESILDALTSNPAVWSKTALFITFDENDGFFDHVPPPAIPSYDANNNLMGASTTSLAGEYYDNSVGVAQGRGTELNPADTISGQIRPYGLGFRVPMYVVSPFSTGGKVNSQVFSHASMGLFLEKMFNVTMPGITPWHRAVCGDLTSVFDFSSANTTVPSLPDTSNFASIDLDAASMPVAMPPSTTATQQPLFQEPGTKVSCALPYELHTSAVVTADGKVTLKMLNTGSQGAVFHVYDKTNLTLIPKRYTVEAGKELDDVWDTSANAGVYDLWVYGPNGFVREFIGNAIQGYGGAMPEIRVCYDTSGGNVQVEVMNSGNAACNAVVTDNVYSTMNPLTLPVAPGQTATQMLSLANTGHWYDFTVSIEGTSVFQRIFAGRVETGQASISDPAMTLWMNRF